MSKYERTESNSHSYEIGGMSFILNADLPITSDTFNLKIKKFQVHSLTSDIVSLNHHFHIPDYFFKLDSHLVYSYGPWKVYRQNGSWIYLHFHNEGNSHNRVALFTENYGEGEIFCPSEEIYYQGNLETISLFPSDQFLFSALLPSRKGGIIHSSAIKIGNHGFLFVGHSGAGKSTISRQLQNIGKIFSDDRVILRNFQSELRVFGTWFNRHSNSISPLSAPLGAVFIIEQDQENVILPLSRKEIIRQLPLFFIKSLPSVRWWDETLDLIHSISLKVPVYRLKFNLDGNIVNMICNMKDTL